MTRPFWGPPLTPEPEPEPRTPTGPLGAAKWLLAGIMLTAIFHGVTDKPAREVEVEVPGPERVIERVTEVPGPVEYRDREVVREVAPDACLDLANLYAEIKPLNEAVSAAASKIPPLTSDSVKFIADGNFLAVNQTIEKLDAAKNELGTAQINLLERTKLLNDAVNDCRTESD